MGVSFGLMPTMEEGDERSSFTSSNAASETSSVVRDSDGVVVHDVPSAYAAELEAAAANFVGMGGVGAGAGAGADADADAAAAYSGGVVDSSSATIGNLSHKKAETSPHEPAAAAAAAPYANDGQSLHRMSISRAAIAKEKSSSIAIHASEVSGTTSISSLFGGGGVGGSEDGDENSLGDDGLGSTLPMSLDSMSKGLASMFGSTVPQDEDAAAAASAAAATAAATATAAASLRPRGISMLRKPSSVAGGGGAASTGPKKPHRLSTSVQLGFGKIKPGGKRSTISER
jgi:hypothetical protein